MFPHVQLPQGIAMGLDDSNSVLLEFCDVHKSFNLSEVLKGISLQIHRGEFFSFLGPSGCGKTTCLRIIAGFEEPSKGEVYLEGSNMKGVPPNKRPLSMVFQDYSLFPHMTIFQNVGFGLVERKEKKPVIREKVQQALEMVKLPGFEKRKPHELSGGQKQRVAIARSIVLNPKLLLLDEPLGALDLKLRKQMQSELKTLQSQLKITFVYVTHDQEEALAMSSRIAVLDQGAVQQIGTPFEIYKKPANKFVADFIGETTFFEGTVVEIKENGAVIDHAGLRTHVEANNLKKSTKVVLSIRPESVRVQAEANSVQNQFQGIVTKSTYKGSAIEYAINLPNGQEIRAICPPQNTPIRTNEIIKVGWGIRDVVVITE